jgi:protein-L-isoaspartate(D-aspartate) O-methyltransferase
MANLSGARKRYARKLRRKAGIRSKRLLRAFAEVPRENFLDPGPWQLLIPGYRKTGYVTTPDAHPRHLYDDVMVGILPRRFLNNGHPSSLASWLDWLDPKPGEHAVHIGCGTGYYTTILAHAVAAGGRVTAVEIDDELAPRARENLAPLKMAKVVHGDGFAVDLESADVIFVNAGATRPSANWLDALSPDGRLLFPLITTQLVQLRSVFQHREGKPKPVGRVFKGRMVGMMIGVRRVAAGYAACGVSSVGIFPCVTAIDRDEDGEVARVLATRPSTRSDHCGATSISATPLAGFTDVRSVSQRPSQASDDDEIGVAQRELLAARGEPVFLEGRMRGVVAKLTDIAQREASFTHRLGWLNLAALHVEKFKPGIIAGFTVSDACDAEHSPCGQFVSDVELSTLEQNRCHTVPLPRGCFSEPDDLRCWKFDALATTFVHQSVFNCSLLNHVLTSLHICCT